MQFDLQKAVAVLGSGPGLTSTPVDAIGMAFGIPRCIIGLSKDVLRALPSSVVQDVSKSLQEGRDFATDKTKDIVKKIFLNTGIIEFDTETGLLKLVSASSSYGLDADGQQSLDELNAIVSAAQAGASMWRNIENISDQIQNISGCIGKLKDAQTFASTNSSLLKAGIDYDASAVPTVTEQYALEIAQVRSAASFIKQANGTLRLAAEVLRERAINPALEPVFNDNVIFSGTTFLTSTDAKDIEEREQIFDLVYGPPKSKKGKFLLSVDGLYYDTGRSDVYDISAIVPPGSIPSLGDRWKFEHDPNLGGKGDAVSLKILNQFFSTIFDENLIDDSDDMQPYYKKDHFLQTLISQKDKHIYDLSSELSKLEAIEGSTDAMVINLKNSISSQTARHIDKINKRKKQIEIAIKAPSYYGNGATYTINSDIPINDFSYLSGVRMPLALEKQKKLVFNQGEVSGIILPIRPTFVTSQEQGDSVNMDHLVVPNIGKGSILQSASSYDGSSATILSLTDNIVTDGLAIIYNFLEPEVVTPGSTKYQVLNCATLSLSGNAQLVGKSSGNVFPSGLAIPYFEGIADFSSTNYISAVGSYAKLPDIAPLRNLTYGPEGCTIDFWTHLPNLGDSGWGNGNVSSLHRLVLACENNGGGITFDEINRMPPRFGSNIVRGMVMGFTRDRQINAGLDPSNESDANLTSSSLSFYIAPTQSVNVSDVTFINNQTAGGDCPDSEGWHSMIVSANSLASDGKSFSDVSSAFMHVAVSISPSRNKVEIYLDSHLMATSSIFDVFGIAPYTSPAIPSFHANSFEYTTSTMGPSSPLAKGPSLHPFFTPWIIGGGYTDGLDSGGFMGTPTNGYSSGLNGHIGSFKIYTKALNSGEVLKNYNAQKAFFKNIQI